MTLKQCYIALEGNYDDAISRLMNERLVTKYVLKFVEDKSFALLQSSLAEHNCAEAFRAAHTIKGVCQNLAFTKLSESACAMTERLRNVTEYDASIMPYFEKLKEDYLQTIAAIQQLDK